MRMVPRLEVPIPSASHPHPIPTPAPLPSPSRSAVCGVTPDHSRPRRRRRRRRHCRTATTTTTTTTLPSLSQRVFGRMWTSMWRRSHVDHVPRTAPPSFGSALLLTLHLTVVSLVGVVAVPAVTLLPALLPSERAWLVDTSRPEPVVVPERTCWEAQGFLLMNSFISPLALPAIFCWLWRLTRGRTAVVLGTTMAATQAVHVLQHCVLPHKSMDALAVAPFLLWPAVVKAVALAAPRCALFGLLHSLLPLTVALASIAFWSLVHDPLGIALSVAVAFPLLKDAFALVARAACRHMPDRAPLRPHRTFVLILYVEMLVTPLSRVYVAQLQGGLLPLVLLFTSAHEIFLRLSLPLRSAVAERCTAALQRRRQADVAAPVVVKVQQVWRAPPLPAPELRAAPPQEPRKPPLRRAHSWPPAARKAGPFVALPRAASWPALPRRPGDPPGGPDLGAAPARRSASPRLPVTGRGIYTLYLVCSAVPEYTSILLVHLLALLNHHHVLWFPLDYYSATGDVDWARPLDPLALLYSLLLQLAAEVAVDCLCFYAVARYGYDARALWRRLPKGTFVAAVFWTGLCAAIGAFSSVLWADNLDLCRGRDLCRCAWGRGLRAHGVRQRYCAHLYPDVTDPANTTSLAGV